jgi:hypothetical protein
MSSEVTQDALVAYMKIYRPEKSDAARVKKILNSFEGRHDQLRSDLLTKYGAEPEHTRKSSKPSSPFSFGFGRSSRKEERPQYDYGEEEKEDRHFPVSSPRQRQPARAAPRQRQFEAPPPKPAPLPSKTGPLTRESLIDFYLDVDPDRVGVVDMMLSEFDSDELVEALMSKFRINPLGQQYGNNTADYYEKIAGPDPSEQQQQHHQLEQLEQLEQQEQQEREQQEQQEQREQREQQEQRGRHREQQQQREQEQREREHEEEQRRLQEEEELRIQEEEDRLDDEHREREEEKHRQRLESQDQHRQHEEERQDLELREREADERQTAWQQSQAPLPATPATPSQQPKTAFSAKNRELLTEFYAQNHPERMGDVDEILRTLTAPELTRRIFQQYGRSPLFESPSKTKPSQVSPTHERRQGGQGGHGGAPQLRAPPLQAAQHAAAPVPPPQAAAPAAAEPKVLHLRAYAAAEGAFDDSRGIHAWSNDDDMGGSPGSFNDGQQYEQQLQYEQREQYERQKQYEREQYEREQDAHEQEQIKLLRQKQKQLQEQQQQYEQQQYEQQQYKQQQQLPAGTAWERVYEQQQYEQQQYGQSRRQAQYPSDPNFPAPFQSAQEYTGQRGGQSSPQGAQGAQMRSPISQRGYDLYEAEQRARAARDSDVTSVMAPFEENVHPFESALQQQRPGGRSTGSRSPAGRMSPSRTSPGSMRSPSRTSPGSMRSPDPYFREKGTRAGDIYLNADIPAASPRRGRGAAQGYDEKEGVCAQQ